MTGDTEQGQTGGEGVRGEDDVIGEDGVIGGVGGWRRGGGPEATSPGPDMDIETPERPRGAAGGKIPNLGAPEVRV